MTSVLYLGCPAAERPHCQRQLGGAGLAIVWTDSIASALAELRFESVPILIDLARGGQAVRQVHEVRARFPLARVFAVADPKRPKLATAAVRAGATDVFSRPLSGQAVAATARRLPERALRHPAIATGLSVRSPAMRAVTTVISLSSAMRAGVLLRGEEGTGRQFLARSMHDSRNGRSGPFVVLDCAAHTADALDRVIFGSPAGSNGRVAAGSLLHQVAVGVAGGVAGGAAGGTLYVRHVAALPGRVQARLAQILRDGEATLLGSGDRISLDVRPIAGVEPGFDRAVHEGRVREDLVRILSVIGIDIPPLRQRREDIPALARVMLREICGRRQLPVKTLSRPAVSLLAALPWHGNISELRALLENIASGPQTGQAIELEDVVPRLGLNGAAPVSKGETLRMARARFEREYIAATLEQTHGRISDAARVLGIRRTNLYRKIRSLRIGEHAPVRF
jgi:two-component system nitrogen regulation response regulator NtrX